MSLILFTACSFKSQDELFQAQQKGKTMFEDFDIKIYEKYKNSENTYDDEGYMFVGFGKWVRQFGYKKDYSEYIKYDKPSILEEGIEYYENGTIKKCILNFRNEGYDMSRKTFDENKKMTSNIDYDEKYAFSGYDLLELMEKKYQEVDMYSEETEVARMDLDIVDHQEYEEYKKNYDFYEEYIPIIKDTEVSYYVVTAIINTTVEKDIKKLEILINAQTGKVMLYGTIDIGEDLRYYFKHKYDE